MSGNEQLYAKIYAREIAGEKSAKVCREMGIKCGPYWSWKYDRKKKGLLPDAEPIRKYTRLAAHIVLNNNPKSAETILLETAVSQLQSASKLMLELSSRLSNDYSRLPGC
jgi:hypothetical protein